MRRSNLLLLGLLRLCAARLPSFSIHEDLLMRPQFEVMFVEQPISEKYAQALLERGEPHPTAYTADFSQSTLDNVREAGDGETKEEQMPPHTYELMKMPPHRYLCLIPVVQPPAPDNDTANKLTKAQEAMQLSRATENGWGLLNPLEDSCLYFMSGWWSYSFCNNREIVQFHALPSTPFGQPPRRDPHTTEYVLGRTPAIPPSAEYQARQEGGQALPAELQVKGDQRYLVQRLEGGTICDLTGRERTVEVQYHCVPGLKGDRIGWIKEVTICAYLMVVNTPRLCDDVTFLPPQETIANAITCQLISDEQSPPLLDDKKKDAEGAPEAEAVENQEAAPEEKPEVTIGGVVVGARHVLSGADEAGKPPAKLTVPRNYFGESQPAERVIAVLVSGEAKDRGGQITRKTPDELDELDVDADVVEEMAQELQSLAGDKGWQLELVEILGDDNRELRGYVDDDDVDGQAGEARTFERKEKGDGKKQADTNEGTGAQEEGEGDGKGDGETGEASDGSQEEFFFKEEL